MLSTGFGSEFTSRCSDVCTRWLQDACLPTANPPLAIAGRRHLRSAYRGRLNFPRVKLASYGGRSFAYAGLRIRTHFLTLETVVFLFHLLSTTSKPFSSLSTRLAHAARLGFLTKTRCINSLLLLLFVIRSRGHKIDTVTGSTVSQTMKLRVTTTDFTYTPRLAVGCTHGSPSVGDDTSMFPVL